MQDLNDYCPYLTIPLLYTSALWLSVLYLKFSTAYKKKTLINAQQTSHKLPNKTLRRSIFYTSKLVNSTTPVINTSDDSIKISDIFFK